MKHEYITQKQKNIETFSKVDGNKSKKIKINKENVTSILRFCAFSYSNEAPHHISAKQKESKYKSKLNLWLEIIFLCFIFILLYRNIQLYTTRWRYVYHFISLFRALWWWVLFSFVSCFFFILLLFCLVQEGEIKRNLSVLNSKQPKKRKNWKV